MTTITMWQAKPDREAAEVLAASKGKGFRVIPVLARIESRRSSHGFRQRTGRLAANAKDVLVLTEIVG
jgi:hypothetical protein